VGRWLRAEDVRGGIGYSERWNDGDEGVMERGREASESARGIMREMRMMMGKRRRRRVEGAHGFVQV